MECHLSRRTGGFECDRRFASLATVYSRALWKASSHIGLVWHNSLFRPVKGWKSVNVQIPLNKTSQLWKNKWYLRWVLFPEREMVTNWKYRNSKYRNSCSIFIATQLNAVFVWIIDFCIELINVFYFSDNGAINSSMKPLSFFLFSEMEIGISMTWFIYYSLAIF